MEAKRYDYISFGLFLLFVGTVAFLTNVNVISWTLLLDFVLRYWPLVLIMAGLKLIGNAKLGKLFGIILDALFFVAVILGLVFAKDSLFPKFAEQIRETKSVSIPYTQYSDAITAEYILTFGAANFEVSDNTSDKFITMTGPSEFTVTPTLTTSKVLQIKTANKPIDRFYRFSSIRNPHIYTVDIGVAEMSSSLEVITGASEGRVTLNELKLSSFTAKVGAGDLQATFSGISVPKKVDLNVGAGRTIVRIKGKHLVRVTYSLGAGSLKLKSLSTNFDKEFGGIGTNGFYEMSPLADVEINVNIGAGAVEIVLD